MRRRLSYSIQEAKHPIYKLFFNTKGWGAIDVDDDQAPYDSYWEVSEGVLSGSWTTLLIEVAGNAGANTFGVFDQSGNMYKLFDGSAGTLDKISMTWNSQGLFSATFDPDTGSPVTLWTDEQLDQVFGYYLGTPGGYFYSDPNINQWMGSNGFVHGNRYEWFISRTLYPCMGRFGIRSFGYR
ncbi:MAG: hypothetical protein ACWGKN_03300 [Desulfoprunum sp.]